MIAPLSLAWPSPVQSSRKRPRPDCPHCGSRLLVAEQSRFDLAGQIDHVWVCDDCGTEFETSIDMHRRELATSDVR